MISAGNSLFAKKRAKVEKKKENDYLCGQNLNKACCKTK
jgi:hypothetical protein